MGKLNEIQQQTTQSYGSNSFTTTIKENTVEFDSAKDKFTFLDPIEAPNLIVNGQESVAFTAADRTKLDNLQTPMQIKGRVDSVEDLADLTDVNVGDVYLVGESGQETFAEYVCTGFDGSDESAIWESVGTTQAQADWNQTDTSAVDYIKNKPTIPSAQVQADWNQNDNTAVDFVKNRPFYQVSAEELIGSVTASSGTVQFQLSKPLVDGTTYKVIKNNSTEISVVANDNGSGMIMLLIEDYHIVFYDPNHQVTQSPNNAFYSGNPDNTAYKIYNPAEVVKLPSVYLDGFLIKKGAGVYSNIFNDYSHNVASGNYSHAEGEYTTASGDDSHSEGDGTTASGFASHSEGLDTTASGNYSHAEGGGTIANHNGQHAFGEYNIADPSSSPASARGTYVEIVGNGTGNNIRSNARTLDWSGNEVLSGTLTAIAGVKTKKLTIAGIDPTDVFMHSEILDASSDVAFSRTVANTSSSKTDGYVEILYKATSGVTCSAYINSADVALTADGAWHKLEQGCDPAEGVEIHINNSSPVADATLEVISKVYYI